MSRVEEILNIADHVPPFPQVAKQVMSLLEDEDTTPADLADVIQYDANITVNLLKTCNSSYDGLNRKVTSLEEALVVLGQGLLKEVIITSGSARFYKGNAGAGYMLEEGELWKHGVAVAIMARKLVPHFEGIEPGTAFTAGLLHDIGKRFIGVFVEQELKQIMLKSHGAGSSFTQAEKDVLGVTHAELGAMVLEKWEFDKDMVAAVKQHHEKDAIEKGGLTALVALSNTLIVSMGIGVGADGLAYTLHGKALEKIGIDSKKIEHEMAGLLMELAKAEEMVNLAR